MSYGASALAGSRMPEVAAAFLHFLQAPEQTVLFAAFGMEAVSE